MALDRIKSVELADNESFMVCEHFNPKTYFKDVIGVTKTRRIPLATVRFEADGSQAPYIETKPLHPSQMVLERDEDTGRVIFQVQVLLNPEFYAQILSFGSGVRIQSPASAVNFMRQTTRSMSEMYGR